MDVISKMPAQVLTSTAIPGFWRLDAARPDWASGMTVQVDASVTLAASTSPLDGSLTPEYTTVPTGKVSGPFHHLRAEGAGRFAVSSWVRLVAVNSDGTEIPC